jgi:hypothetical protein
MQRWHLKSPCLNGAKNYHQPLIQVQIKIKALNVGFSPSVLTLQKDFTLNLTTGDIFYCSFDSNSNKEEVFSSTSSFIATTTVTQQLSLPEMSTQHTPLYMSPLPLLPFLHALR